MQKMSRQNIAAMEALSKLELLYKKNNNCYTEDMDKFVADISNSFTNIQKIIVKTVYSCDEFNHKFLNTELRKQAYTESEHVSHQAIWLARMNFLKATKTNRINQYGPASRALFAWYKNKKEVSDINEDR